MSAVATKRGLDFTNDSPIEITIATHAGACFGVVRAIKLGYSATRMPVRDGRVFSLGPLIHNPTVVRELEQKGIRAVSSPDEVDGGVVIVRCHGVQKEAEAKLQERGIPIIDATCPLVKKPQRLAQDIGRLGYFLIIVGSETHPEVKGVLSYYGQSTYLVTYAPADIERVPSSVKKVGILAQTTIELSIFHSVTEAARQRFDEVLVHNTICSATSVRQSEAEKLARAADVVVVVGGKNSSNTNKLVKICSGFQPNTFHVEERTEIRAEWFMGKGKIAVTGGASTPHDTIDQVGTYIAELIESRTRQAT